LTDAQGAGAETVSKGEFAALCGVSPGRVSQWISEGKMTEEALDGQGPRARVRVDIAQAQLRSRIDVGQRFGNGLKTRLRAPLARHPNEPAGATQAPMAPLVDTIEEQIKREKLREIEFKNREALKKELASRGEYVRTIDVRVGYDQVAMGMVNVFEGALTDFAQAVAARFEVPQRDVLHLLRGEFRKVRASAAQAARRAGSELPAAIEDEASASAEAA
jgi:DNA-binding transcriptional regulator YdaS (Cro superfamily)